MDMNRLSMGERLAGGAAVLLLITSFIPLWAKYEISADFGEFGDFSTADRFSAWSGAFNFLMKLALILALVVAALVIAKAASVDVSAIPPVALLGAAGLSFLLILLMLLIGPQEFGLAGPGLEVSRGPMLLVGAILSAAMAGGAFLHFQGAGGTAAMGPAPTPPPAPPA